MVRKKEITSRRSAGRANARKMFVSRACETDVRFVQEQGRTRGKENARTRVRKREKGNFYISHNRNLRRETWFSCSPKLVFITRAVWITTDVFKKTSDTFQIFIRSTRAWLFLFAKCYVSDRLIGISCRIVFLLNLMYEFFHIPIYHWWNHDQVSCGSASTIQLC